MILQAVTGTVFFHGYATFAPFWMAEFGWSRTTISLVFSLHRTESALLGPLQGWILQTYSPRRVVLVGIIMLGTGFLFLSMVNGLVGFVAAFLYMAVGASFCGVLSFMTVIVNWFDRRRSTALSLMHLGFSLGGLAIPLLAIGLVTYGWRPMAVVSGLVVLATGVPIARLMHRDPEALGLMPDGVPSEAVAGNPTQRPGGSGTAPASPILTVRQALRTRAFWLSSLGQAAALAVGAAVMVHFVVFAHEGIGLPVTTAAYLVALMTGMMIAGQLIGGFLGDRFDKAMLAGVSVLGMAVAMVMFSLVQSAWALAVAVTVHGLLSGMRAPLLGALKAELFGRKNFATVSGFSSLITMVGAIGGPVFVGIIADQTGAYATAFLVLGAISAIGSLAFFFLRPPIADRPHSPP